jgi:hypothetical protein
MAQIIDSVSEALRDDAIPIYSGTPGIGQSFIGNGGTLNYVKFFGGRSNSPTGTCNAKLYSHSGTYGTSSVPNTLLATSQDVDITTLPTIGSPALFTINFVGTGKIKLTSGTHYLLTFEYTGGDVTNNMYISFDTAGGGTHAGNICTLSGGTWSANSSNDLCFYAYKDDDSSMNSPYCNSGSPIIKMG